MKNFLETIIKNDYKSVLITTATFGCTGLLYDNYPLACSFSAGIGLLVSSANVLSDKKMSRAPPLVHLIGVGLVDYFSSNPEIITNLSMTSATAFGLYLSYVTRK